MDADNAVRSMRERGLPLIGLLEFVCHAHPRAESRAGAYPGQLRSAMINNVRSVQQIVRSLTLNVKGMACERQSM
ncbi:hypothetical protein SAT01_05780 [Sinomonas atrocyanea]|nr:hypothetical protein SAT01_05780 [Sinomonas atrocyanea]GGG80474.1 hypothetical protein GCM10007172_37160 [Sinomonas atrocyanea]